MSGKKNSEKKDQNPKVFISYSHDSPGHCDRVLALSNRLRGDGIDCILDQYEQSPPGGWPKWMDRNIREADFVIIICTEIYSRRVEGKAGDGEGLGVKWESTLAYNQIYQKDSKNENFIPVLFKKSDEQYIPTPLKGVTYYCLDSTGGYEDLYRRLTDQPHTEKPPLGILREMPKKDRVTDFFCEEKVEDTQEAKRLHFFSAFSSHFIENYEIVGDRIGGGFFFDIYHLRHRHRKEEVDYVLKILNLVSTIYYIKRKRKNILNVKEEYDRKRDRFLERVCKLRRFISKPNIVGSCDAGVLLYNFEGVDYEVPYSLVKYVKGIKLKELICKQEPLKIRMVLGIAEGILSALKHIHEEKFICWNILPDRIVIKENSTEPVLLDAGLPDDRDVFKQSTIIKEDIALHELIGYTLRYLLFRSSSTFREQGIAADIFLFGALLYQMVAIEMNYKAFIDVLSQSLNKPLNLEKIPPTLPNRIAEIIKKTVARRPKERYKSVEEVLYDIREFKRHLDLD